MDAYKTVKVSNFDPELTQMKIKSALKHYIKDYQGAYVKVLISPREAYINFPDHRTAARFLHKHENLEVGGLPVSLEPFVSEQQRDRNTSEVKRDTAIAKGSNDRARPAKKYQNNTETCKLPKSINEIVREFNATRAIFVGNIQKSTTEEDLMRIFSEFGSINKVTVIHNPGRNFAFVEYFNMDMAQDAINNRERLSIRGNPLKVNYAHKSISPCIWIGGIGKQTNEQNLINLLKEAAPLREFVWPAGKPYAYALFNSVNDAQKVMDRMHGTVIDSRYTRLRLDFVQKRDMHDKRNFEDGSKYGPTVSHENIDPNAGYPKENPFLSPDSRCLNFDLDISRKTLPHGFDDDRYSINSDLLTRRDESLVEDYYLDDWLGVKDSEYGNVMESNDLQDVVGCGRLDGVEFGRYDGSEFGSKDEFGALGGVEFGRLGGGKFNALDGIGFSRHEAEFGKLATDAFGRRDGFELGRLDGIEDDIDVGRFSNNGLSSIRDRIDDLCTRAGIYNESFKPASRSDSIEPELMDKDDPFSISSQLRDLRELCSSGPSSREGRWALSRSPLAGDKRMVLSGSPKARNRSMVSSRSPQTHEGQRLLPRSLLSSEERKHYKSGERDDKSDKGYRARGQHSARFDTGRVRYNAAGSGGGFDRDGRAPEERSGRKRSDDRLNRKASRERLSRKMSNESFCRNEVERRPSRRISKERLNKSGSGSSKDAIRQNTSSDFQNVQIQSRRNMYGSDKRKTRSGSDSRDRNSKFDKDINRRSRSSSNTSRRIWKRLEDRNVSNRDSSVSDRDRSVLGNRDRNRESDSGKRWRNRSRSGSFDTKGRKDYRSRSRNRDNCYHADGKAATGHESNVNVNIISSSTFWMNDAEHSKFLPPGAMMPPMPPLLPPLQFNPTTGMMLNFPPINFSAPPGFHPTMMQSSMNPFGPPGMLLPPLAGQNLPCSSDTFSGRANIKPSTSRDKQSFNDSSNLLKSRNFPVVWSGAFLLKTSAYVSNLYLVSGSIPQVSSLLKDDNKSECPILDVSQRLRYTDSNKIEELEAYVERAGHKGCSMLLTSPTDVKVCDDDLDSDIQQCDLSTLGSYLRKKECAAVVILPPGDKMENQPGGVMHVFPNCEFAQNILRKEAPELCSEFPTDEHLLVLIVCDK